VSQLRAVFVDTGAWVALRYGRDQYHGRAVALLRRLRADGLGLVTTEWVMAEAVTLLKARGAAEHALRLGEAIQAGRLGYLVESTAERRRRAWELFVRYRDRRVGWVDCASFAVMDELSLQQFFGFDDDFARAGFTAYR
jgi:predicted nucleic acid-binding protein